MQCTSIVFLPKHPESNLEKSIIQIPIERYFIKHLTGNTQHCQGQQKNSKCQRNFEKFHNVKKPNET